jgi:ketosteroid isomerase-like protein
MTTDAADLEALSHSIASAISKRDVAALRALLAPGFVARSPHGASGDADAFLSGITSIPGDIAFVHVENLQVDVHGDGALVTGQQHAQVTIDGAVIDDHRSFVDFFVRTEGTWLLRVAVDIGGS